MTRHELIAKLRNICKLKWNRVNSHWTDTIDISIQSYELSLKCKMQLLEFKWYDHTDNDMPFTHHIHTDIPVWIYIKMILIYPFGFISNRYRYICLAPYQTDTDTDNRFKPILTDYLQVLFYISANFTDTYTYIHHTDSDYPFWIYIKPIPIYLFGSISNGLW